MSENTEADFAQRAEAHEHEKYQEGPRDERPYYQALPPFVQRRDPALYLGLTIAALCILGAFGVASFFAGFMTAKMSGGNSALADMKKQMMIKKIGDGWQGNDGGIVGKVAIVQNGDKLQFTQQAFKMMAGSGIAWVNQTSQPQLIVGDSSQPMVKVAPGESSTMFLKEGNRTYVLHLASDPNVTITIYVGGKS